MKAMPRRVTCALLVMMALLSFALRYPTDRQESGVDSFVFHGLAQTILDRGYAAWLLNPLSLMGLYPLSHPSSPVILTAVTSSLGAVPPEGSILLLDMVVALIGLFASFMMGRAIKPDDRFALLVAFLVSTAPRFVSNLIWQMPTRTLFTAFVPIFVWAVLRLHRRVGALEISVLGVILFLMMTAHRLTVIMAIVLTAYIVASIFVATVHMLRTAYSATFLAGRMRRALRWGSWALVGITAAYILILSDVLGAYERGKIGGDPGLIGQVENLGVSLARSSGLLLPLAAFGILAIARSHATDVREPWLIASLLGILPTLALRQYTGYYFAPFAAIFVGLGVLFIYQVLVKRPRVRQVFLVAVIVFSLASSLFVIRYESEVEQYMIPSVNSGGIYVRHMPSGTFVANSGILGVEIHAVSGSAYMPIGGATTAGQGPEILAFGFLRPRDMNVRLIPVSSLTIEDDSLFVLDGVNFEIVWADMLSRPITDSRVLDTIHKYNVTLFIERSSIAYGFEAYGKVYASPFAESVHEGRYVVFITEQYLTFLV